MSTCCYNIHQSSTRGHIKCIDTFVKNGIDSNEEGRFKYTPLYCAIQYKHVDAVKFLIDNRADVNKQCNNIKFYPLHIAVEVRNYDIIMILVEAGADPSIRDFRGKKASECTDDPIIKNLIESYDYSLLIKEPETP